MVNRGMLVLGGVLIGLGVLFFLGSIFKIDIGALCCPLVLIIAGVLMVVRPNLSGRGGPSRVVLIGDVKRKGAWEVDDMEYWLGVAELELDMSQALIPAGETQITAYGFVNDVELRLPADVAVCVEGAGMVVNTKIFGRKLESVFAPVQYKSEGYDTAARKINLQIVGFVVEVKVKQV
jgi:hypothetical protein